jgi:hypothetical protein
MVHTHGLEDWLLRRISHFSDCTNSASDFAAVWRETAGRACEPLNIVGLLDNPTTAISELFKILEGPEAFPPELHRQLAASHPAYRLVLLDSITDKLEEYRGRVKDPKTREWVQYSHEKLSGYSNQFRSDYLLDDFLLYSYYQVEFPEIRSAILDHQISEVHPLRRDELDLWSDRFPHLGARIVKRISNVVNSVGDSETSRAISDLGERGGQVAVAANRMDRPSDSPRTSHHVQARDHFPYGPLRGHLSQLAYATRCPSGSGPKARPNTRFLKHLVKEGKYLLEQLSPQYYSLYFSSMSEYDDACARLEQYTRDHKSKRGGPRCKSAPSA